MLKNSDIASYIKGSKGIMSLPLYHRCRFSQMLHPIFEEASNLAREEYPDITQVVFARVDCDQHCKSGIPTHKVVGWWRPYICVFVKCVA